MKNYVLLKTIFLSINNSFPILLFFLPFFFFGICAHQNIAVEQETFCHEVRNNVKKYGLISFELHTALKNVFNQGMYVCLCSQCLDTTLLSHFFTIVGIIF